MMRKILCITLTFAFTKATFTFPVTASKEHDTFLSERDQIIKSTTSYDVKKNQLQRQSEIEQKRIQSELSETAKTCLNANQILNSQIRGCVEAALTWRNGQQFKTISFEGAGKSTLEKFTDFFPNQKIPETFNLSVESLSASTRAIDQNLKSSLITELRTKDFSSEKNRKLDKLWKEYIDTKLSMLLLAGTQAPEKESDYDLLMTKATAPENTADLMTNLLLQKSAEKLAVVAVKDLSAKQRAIAEQHERINLIGNTPEAISLRNNLIKEQKNLDEKASLLRDQVARVVGYAGTFLDGRIKSILNIEAPLKLLEDKRTVVRLAKELALSPEVLAVTGTSSNKKLSDEEIDKLASKLQKGLPQSAATSTYEKVLRESFNALASLRNNISLSKKNEQEIIEFLKKTLGPVKDLTTKALRLHVTNAFKGQAFEQFKKDMLGALTTMARLNKMNLETLLNDKIFTDKMKEVSSKIINGTADEDSKSFVAWWARHTEANLPVYAAQTIEKTRNPSVQSLTGKALENALAHAGAEELYLEKLEKSNQGQNVTPHREHIQPYVDTAITPDVISEAMVTMMAKKIVDQEMSREQEKMQSTTDEMLKKIQRDTIRQLESLSKELESEEKLVLEFWGVLENLKARVMASMIQTPAS